MATLRKRGDKWHTQVRLKGQPTITKSFSYKSDAEAWARAQEAPINHGVSSSCATTISLGLSWSAMKLNCSQGSAAPPRRDT